MIALENGGSPGLGNFVPLCRRCNSSKGTRDLLEWWYRRGASVADLPDDVLTTYVRLTLRRYVDRDRHNFPAERWHRSAVADLSALLPTAEHHRAVSKRIGVITGRTFTAEAA